MLASTAFVACTNDVETVENGAVAKGEKSYMAVNLVTPNAGSRAAEDGKYTDGEDYEVAVENVRFYFFDKDGNAYPVGKVGNDEVNYFEPKAINFAVKEPANDNVNSQSNAVIVIEQNKNTPPASVVAVLNAEELNLEGFMSLSELKGLDYSITDGIAGCEAGKFVMTNSVYKTQTNDVVTATLIPFGSICSSPEDAKNAPVSIYVERVVAKVSTDATETSKFPIGEKFGGNDVYAKILGWEITNYNDQSFLFKSLEGWENWNFTNWDWNAAYHFRSFWAKSVNPTPAGTATATVPNTEYKNDQTFAEMKGNYSAKYCLENTNENNNTQLLVAAQLQDVNGNALEIAQWMGVKYTVDDLKTQLAGTLASEYFQLKEGTTDGYESINKDYITFVNPANSWKEEEKRYTVNAKLTLPEGKTLYKEGLNAKNEKTMLVVGDDEIAVINEKLASSPIWLWTTGYTYYYLPIEHLGGKNGIVRNHLYDISITAINGFGTPVYDPEEIILPQRPIEDESYIAAQVNILSWKVVKNEVELN